MKTKLSLLMVCFMFVFTGSAFAVSIGDWVQVDPLVDQALLSNSSEASEIQYFADYLEITYAEAEASYEKFNFNGFTAVTDIALHPDTYFYDFGADLSPGYFMLKLGVPAATAKADTFIFENIEATRYAVVNSSQFAGNGFDFNLGRISHFAINGDSPVFVPEPASLLLFGAGLAGLAVYRRRSSK